jgi:post-segregation antitoxin (ccd killing protein)
MTSLTISVDAHLLERARARALALGTSVNALLRQHLEAFAGGHGEREEALRELFALAERSTSRSRGRRFDRDELHDR